MSLVSFDHWMYAFVVLVSVPCSFLTPHTYDTVNHVTDRRIFHSFLEPYLLATVHPTLSYVGYVVSYLPIVRYRQGGIGSRALNQKVYI